MTGQHFEDLAETMSVRQLRETLGITEAQRIAWQRAGRIPSFIPGTHRYLTRRVMERLGLDADGQRTVSLPELEKEALRAVDRWDK